MEPFSSHQPFQGPCDPRLTDDKLRLRLAGELDNARRMLDITGDELTADPEAIARHHLSLQYLDMVGQILGHVAAVIRSSDREAAVEAICMSDLRTRLSGTGAD